MRVPAAVVDPVLVGLVGLVVYALHGYDGTLSRDLGIFVYGGEHVAQGVPPYAGIFNSVGPLADALPGLAIWVGNLVGADPVLAARVGFTVLAAGCCALLCVLARDAFGSRAAGLVAPAVFLTFEEFLRLASDGPREKTAMVLFLLATLLLLGRRRWFLAGAATALATLTWQPVLLPAVAGAAVALLGARAGRLRGAATYVLGGAVPTAAVVAFYAARGDLRLAIDGFVTVNAQDTSQPSLLTSPAVRTDLWYGYHQSLLVLLVGLAALLVVTAAAAPDAVRQEPGAVAVASLGAAGLAATAWTTAVINGAPDLFVVLPFGALGAAGAAAAVVRRLRPGLGRSLVAAVTVTAVTAAAAEAVGTRNDMLDRQRADVAAVLAAARPGATVLTVNAPEVLAIARRDNPTRYQLFDPPMQAFLDRSTRGGLKGYAAYIARTHPTLVAIPARLHASWLEPVLSADYVQAGHGPTWTWYVARAAGPAEAIAVRAANASVTGRRLATVLPAQRLHRLRPPESPLHRHARTGRVLL